MASAPWQTQPPDPLVQAHVEIYFISRRPRATGMPDQPTVGIVIWRDQMTEVEPRVFQQFTGSRRKPETVYTRWIMELSRT